MTYAEQIFAILEYQEFTGRRYWSSGHLEGMPLDVVGEIHSSVIESMQSMLRLLQGSKEESQ